MLGFICFSCRLLSFVELLFAPYTLLMNKGGVQSLLLSMCFMFGGDPCWGLLVLWFIARLKVADGRSKYCWDWVVVVVVGNDGCILDRGWILFRCW